MMIITPKYPLYPHLLTTREILKAGATEIYRPYMFQNGIAREVVEYLQSRNDRPEFLDTQPGKIIEDYLINMKSRSITTPEQKSYRETLENQSSEGTRQGTCELDS